MEFLAFTQKFTKGKFRKGGRIGINIINKKSNVRALDFFRGYALNFRQNVLLM